MLYCEQPGVPMLYVPGPIGLSEPMTEVSAVALATFAPLCTIEQPWRWFVITTVTPYSMV